MIPLVHGSCSFARIALANIQAGAHWISVGMKKSVTIQLKSGAAKVYRLDASELCGVVQEASKRRIDNREASVSCTAERSCCQHCT